MKAAPWNCTASCREQPMMIVFYVASAVAILSTALMITRLHAVHALLYLIVSLLAVSVVFYTLGAPFIAALEVIVYAGAIMVLFVFVVMLLNLGEQAAQAERALLKPSMWAGPSILAVILVGEFLYLLAKSSGGSSRTAMMGPVKWELRCLGLT